MRKVLILTYWYPPKNVIGAVRLTKFAKYLSQFGWEPVVVTVDPRTDLYTKTGKLHDDLVSGNVYRTGDWSYNELLYALYRRIRPQRDPGNAAAGATAAVNRENFLSKLYRQIFCFPDEAILWRFFSMSKIRRIVRDEKPDLIFSSSLPNTVHLMANALHRKFKIPWVADFRDLWTQNPYTERINLLRGLEERMERRALSKASAMITISDGLKQDLESRYTVPVHTIPNGFDPDEVETSSSNLPQKPDAQKLTLTFTGTIYPGKRDPSPLLEAMLQLKQEGRLAENEILIRFYGRKQEFIAELLASRFRELSAMVELCGAVSREEALQAQRDSTALLLLEWVDPRAQGVYTGKIFEYLAAHKPILSIGPEGGVLEKLIEETNSGFQATAPSLIAERLHEWLAMFRIDGSIQHCPNQVEISKYSRKSQTERLASIFDGVIEGGV